MAVIPITKSRETFRNGETGLPSFTADRVATWTTSAGIMTPTSAQQSYLSPNNQTRLVTVTATSGGNVGNATIQIFATFPLQPNFGYEVELDDKTLSSIAEDGTAVFRIKGADKRSWQLQMPDRPISEYQTLTDFWLFHRKYIEFYYEDLALGELRLVRFDSGIKITAAGPDQISMNCLVREV